MAARENQGLHIALILFVMLTALLALLCYFTLTSSNEKADLLASKEEELSTQKKIATAYQIQADVLKMYIGFGTMTEEEAQGQIQLLPQYDTTIANEMATITQQYEDDMGLFDVAYPDLRNYRELPQHLAAANNVKNGVIVNSEESIDQWINKRDTDVAAADERADAADTRAEAHLTSLQNAEDAFNSASDNIADQQTESTRLATEARSDQIRELAESQDTINTLNGQITELQETVSDKVEIIQQYEATEFDIADGEITEVSARTGIVWINVGFADHLPQNATFSVYPQDSAQFRDEGVKATIEVKRILGDHYAEAVVTSESVTDPIVPGDVINTTTWSPGRVQTFGIAGFIDIDGNGRSDAARLRNIIQRNGGLVVAYIDDEGNVVGEMDAKTRYLITGDDFRVGSFDEATLQDMVKSTTELNTQARDQAVEVKYFEELLEEMGYHGESSVQGVGTTDPGDFAPRTPPARGANGAYN